MPEPKAKGLDRGETMRTVKRVANERCALVQMFSTSQLEQAKPFQTLKNNSVYFLTNHTELTTKFGHLNHAELVDSFAKEAHKAHLGIAPQKSAFESVLAQRCLAGRHGNWRCGSMVR